MNVWSTVWLVIFCCAALLFFATAAVIAVFGARDLKYLLSRSPRADEHGSRKHHR